MKTSEINKILYEKAEEKGHLDYIGNEYYAYGLMHTVLASEIKEYLEYIGIPYTAFNIRDNKKDLLVFQEKNYANVIEIEKGLRIRLGLELSSKEDLCMAIFENNKLTMKNDKIFSITGLSDFMAYRLKNLMANEHLVAVLKMYPDFTYEIATHKKNQKSLEKLLFQVFTEEQAIEQEKDKITKLHKSAIDINKIYQSIEDETFRGEHFIVSAMEPDTYISITPDNFTYFKNGEVKFGQPFSSTFTERLALCLSLIENPIVTDSQRNVDPEIKEAINVLKALDKTNVYMQKGTELYNNVRLQNDVLVVDLPDAEPINEFLENITLKTEIPGVTLEYLMESDYGYDVDNTIKIAKGAYIKEHTPDIPNNTTSGETENMEYLEDTKEQTTKEEIR